MKKKPIALPMPDPPDGFSSREWHNGGEIEIYSYSRSLRKAATALLERHELGKADWDVCPIILLYRQSLELHMKSVVGDGSNFLKTRTDAISIAQTHSIRWLAQLICQIIKAVGWEREFTCEGTANLAEFNALVIEIESLDPVLKSIRSIESRQPDLVTHFYRTFDIVKFAARLDALLDLLDVTSDALAATWDSLQDQTSFPAGPAFKPTIH